VIPDLPPWGVETELAQLRATVTLTGAPPGQRLGCQAMKRLESARVRRRPPRLSTATSTTNGPD
jgi:hypothetical protein